MDLGGSDEITLIHDYYRTLIENSVDLIFILDEEAIIKFASPSVERVLGYTPDEITGTCAYEYIQFDEIKRANSAVEQMLTDYIVDDQFEFHVEHKDGHWLHMELVGVNHLDHPEINGIVVNARDISRRKAIEEELRRTEERFGIIIDSLTETISITSVEGEVGFVGKPIYWMLGYEPEEMDTMNFFDLVHPDDLGKVIANTMAVAEKQGNCVRSTCRVKHKNGQWRYIEATSINYADNPAIAGIVSISRDITDRVILEENHVTAMNAFIDDISQEFRQVLTVLKGYSSLLRKEGGKLDAATCSMMLETMEEGSNRLNNLVAGLHAMSREAQKKLGVKGPDAQVLLS